MLIGTALLTNPSARAAEPPPSSLSGTGTDADRTMQGYVDAHAQQTISKWLGANPHRDLTLRLDSRGGLAKYGLLLYDAINTHGRVSTDVGPGQVCLSSCAYMWLAGQTRTIAERAELGFHSAACPGPCDPRVVGLINQSVLDILARTEPALAVLVSNTGAMIAGNRRVALAHLENGRWAMRTFEPPTTVAQR